MAASPFRVLHSSLQEETGEFFRQNEKFYVVAESAEHRAAIFETQAKRMSIPKRESGFISRKRLLPSLDLPPPGKDLKVQIRWMTTLDMSKVLAIEEAVSDFPWSKKEFQVFRRKMGTVGMVAEFNKKIAGYMLYEFHRSRIHLASFSVHPSAQDRGVDRQMVEGLKSKLAPLKSQSLFLEIPEEGTAARAFFKSMGFRAISVLRDYYGDGRDAYKMEYRLPPRGVDVLPREELEEKWDSLSEREARTVVESALSWKTKTGMEIEQVAHRFKIQPSETRDAVILARNDEHRFWDNTFLGTETAALLKSGVPNDLPLQEWIVYLPQEHRTHDALLRDVSEALRVDPAERATRNVRIILPEFTSGNPYDALFEDVLDAMNRRRIAGAIASGLEEGMAAEAAPVSDSFEQSARSLDDLRRYYP